MQNNRLDKSSLCAQGLDKRLKNLPAGIWNKITQIDELKGQWIAGAKLSPQVLGRLKKSVLITSTGVSTLEKDKSLSRNAGLSCARFYYKWFEAYCSAP